MLPYQVKTWSFFVPFLLGLVGGFFQHNYPDLTGVYVLAYISAGASILWIFFYTWMTEKPMKDLEEAHKIEEFKTLTPDQRVEMGYKKSKSRIDVVHHWKDHKGFEPRTSFDWIPWSEGRLQEFITATLRGVAPKFANWEGPGRLFPDGEFEKGMNKFLEPDIAYFVKKGSASNSPREITDAGLLAFVQYVEDLGIPYEIKPEFQERLIKMRGEQ